VCDDGGLGAPGLKYGRVFNKENVVKHKVLCPLNHDNVAYPVGAEIDVLTNEQANALSARGIVAVIPEETLPKTPVVPSEPLQAAAPAVSSEPASSAAPAVVPTADVTANPDVKSAGKKKGKAGN
jgi:hypothetical protein